VGQAQTTADLTKSLADALAGLLSEIDTSELILVQKVRPVYIGRHSQMSCIVARAALDNWRRDVEARAVADSGPDYPAWVCKPCALGMGGRGRFGHVGTCRVGGCGICGKRSEVTLPGDWGHFVPEQIMWGRRAAAMQKGKG
jgi:hypothetical protein